MERPGLLWVGRDQPSRHGSGSQQRAAQILLALADHFAIHVVVITVGRSLAGVRDEDLFDRFASFEQLRVEEPAGEPSALPDGAGGPAGIAPDDVPLRLAERRRRKEVAVTLIVTFELAVSLRSVLEQLQPAYIELDELATRRQQRFLATPDLPPDKLDEFRRGLRLMSILERQLLPQFRGVLVSSALEHAHLRGLVPDQRVSVVPNATHQGATLPPVSPARPRTIMFVGRMDYFPNHDAVRSFLGAVWPLLRRRYGDDVRLHVVGAGAPASFQPEKTAGVVFDRNRADIVPVYREASVAVVPIRSGGGTRVKIVEAFALGRPVVSTTMGAEGLDVEHGRHLLLADTPQAFADACATLIDDPDKAAALVAVAADWVQRHHSTTAVRAAIAASVIVGDLRS